MVKGREGVNPFPRIGKYRGLYLRKGSTRSEAKGLGGFDGRVEGEYAKRESTISSFGVQWCVHILQMQAFFG